MATLTIDRPAEPVLVPSQSEVQPMEATARLSYAYHYYGDADPHLSGQPCSLLLGADRSVPADSYAVAFACGCRDIVPGWTLSRNS